MATEFVWILFLWIVTPDYSGLAMETFETEHICKQAAEEADIIFGNKVVVSSCRPLFKGGIPDSL